jgi:hypothetical protein
MQNDLKRNSRGMWWRAYASALNDRKLQTMPAELFRHWFNLLCIAALNDGDIDIEQAAFVLRLTDEEAVKVFSDLSKLSLIEEIEPGTYSAVDWRIRQFASDNSTERWSRWRDRQRSNVGANVGSNVADVDGDGDGDLLANQEREVSVDSRVNSGRVMVAQPSDENPFP